MLAEKITPTSHAGEEQSSSTAGGFAARSAHWGYVRTGLGTDAAAATASAAPVQCWSTVNEGFEAETLSNLIIANDWLRAGDIVYVGEKKAIKLSDLISADDILVLMSQRATALAGDAADGYPNITPKQKDLLSAAVWGFIALACPPDFLGVQNIRRHSVTDLDLGAAARAMIGGEQ
jgi:hypothetical protein